MHESRFSDRFSVSIPVRLSGPSGEVSACMVDVSLGGAGVHCTLGDIRPGDKVKLIVADRGYPAQVAWASMGRLGVKFDQALTHGPLYHLAKALPELAA